MKIIIKNREISSVSLGYGNFAWKISDCQLILEYMKEKGIYVLGGDVLDLQRRYIYAMWTYKENPSLSYIENAKFSIDKALEYITWFMGNKGTDYLIDIVTDKASEKEWPPRTME